MNLVKGWAAAVALTLALALAMALALSACGGTIGDLDPDCTPRDPKFPYCTDEPWDGGPIAF